MFAPILASFALGCIHALGPDHCLAVASLGARGKQARRVLWIAVRFASGHLLIFAAGFCVLRIASHVWPAWLDRAGEMAAGVALTLIGASLVGEGVFSRLGFHVHRHSHGALEHLHPHTHGSHPDHAHQHASGLTLGALFALGGLRTLLIALPAATAPGSAPAVAGIIAFGLGIFLTMAAYGLAVTRVFSLLGQSRAARWAPQAVGWASIVAGVTQVVLAS